MGQPLLVEVDTSVPYPPSTTQHRTVKLSQKYVCLKEEDASHLHSLSYSLDAFIFKTI